MRVNASSGVVAVHQAAGPIGTPPPRPCSPRVAIARLSQGKCLPALLPNSLRQTPHASDVTARGSLVQTPLFRRRQLFPRTCAARYKRPERSLTHEADMSNETDHAAAAPVALTPPAPEPVPAPHFTASKFKGKLHCRLTHQVVSFTLTGHSHCPETAHHIADDYVRGAQAAQDATFLKAIADWKAGSTYQKLTALAPAGPTWPPRPTRPPPSNPPPNNVSATPCGTPAAPFLTSPRAGEGVRPSGRRR